VYHNPRLWGAGQPFSLSPRRVDELVHEEATVVDIGEKKGSADNRLKAGMARTLENVEKYGLRVANVVLISGDVDYNGACEWVGALRLQAAAAATAPRRRSGGCGARYFSSGLGVRAAAAAAAAAVSKGCGCVGSGLCFAALFCPTRLPLPRQLHLLVTLTLSC